MGLARKRIRSRPAVPANILTPLIVACALFMENLDGTVIATSLPAIAADLGEDPIALKLALTSYLLSLAIFIPASGWAADRFGARTVFRTAIVGFTLGSVLCGLSSTLPEFIAARVLQGIGGAMMVPVGRLVLVRAVPRAELVRAMAYLSVPALLGPVLGPPVGGFITTYFHWRWIFWINVPIGAIGVVLATMFVPNVKEEAAWPLDRTGFFLSGAGLAALIFGLTVAGRGFMPASANAVLIAAGIALVALYIRHARRVPFPIIDLELLRVPTFAAAIVGGFLFRIGIGAIPFLLPLLFQAGFGLTPFESGSLTFVAAAGAMLMKTTAAPILRNLGFRQVLVWNTFICTGFLCINALFRPSTPHLVVIAILLAGGFFRSLQFTSLNALAFADVDNRAMSRATSFSAVAQQLSLSVGVSVGAAGLEFARGLHGGGALAVSDFTPAFLLVAALSAMSVVVFWRLEPDAGALVSGRRVADVRGPTPQPGE
jgi:EmrB/QacA subfamily drug resistance transporter